MGKPQLKTQTYSLELAALLSRRTRRQSGVRQGKMFGYPAFYVGGRMIGCVYANDVGLKLPASRVRELLEQGRLKPFRPYGKPAMREWIAMSSELAATRLGAALLREAITFGTETGA